MAWLILLAGPNGAGKSTTARTVLRDLPIIDTDAIAAGLRRRDPAASSIVAGRKSLQRISRSFARRRSFAVETTLSGAGPLRRVRAAKNAGWNVAVVYVGLADADLAVLRVRSRVAAGGHGVPESDIRRRYRRSLDNLPAACRLADIGLTFDNSGPPGEMRLLARLARSRLAWAAPQPPEWAKRALARL
jgi:predicted ABC-type ATPase